MVQSNNAINNTVGASISGVTNTLTVTNPSNSASSAARSTITVGGASAADPTLNFNVSGVTNFEMGIDNNASDSFKLAASAALGTTDTFIMTTSGERTMPLQPAFYAGFNSAVNNISGDGTSYIFGDTDVGAAMTEDFDIGSNFTPGASGGAVFTAPVAGKYWFCAGCSFSCSAAHTRGFLALTASGGQSLRFAQGNWANMRDSINVAFCCGSGILDLSAAETVQIALQIFNGAKTVSIQSATVPNAISYFQGALLF